MLESQTDSAGPVHVPVMAPEVLDALNVVPGGRYVDCTVGGGGHAYAILQAAQPGGRLLGLDADPDALRAAEASLQPFSGHYHLVHAHFDQVEARARDYGFVPADGVLYDLGLSSLQLAAPGRGFSFQRDDPLDMRFSPDEEMTAADVVNTYDETRLADTIYAYGEEPASRRIAREIVRRRPLRTTQQLARAVEAALGGRRGRIHPATRTFQAIRMEVNQELPRLEASLTASVHVLRPGGRLAALTYHSLEDRALKTFIRSAPDITPLYKKARKPAREEVLRNPRARSAKLRAAVKAPAPRAE